MPPRQALLPLLFLVGCATVPSTEMRTVVVHNPTGAAVQLHKVVRDGFGAVRDLGDAAQIDLVLPPGRYALSVVDEGPRFALPLLLRELGFEPPVQLELTVRPMVPAERDWCWVPAGLAVRGDALGIGQEDERPVSAVASDGFWLASHETTNADYVQFLNEVGMSNVDVTWLDLDGAKCRVQHSSKANEYTTDAPDLPVVTVSYAGAVAYCEWRTRKSGVRHRLPTEAEWEKAARGPGSRVYAYGDTFRTSAANQESGRLRPIRLWTPNGYGLYDMTGNAFEWCADSYVRGAYAGETASEPAEFRVLRGGSYVLDGIFCRNAMRMRLRPDVRADDVGFRALRERRPDSR